MSVEGLQMVKLSPKNLRKKKIDKPFPQKNWRRNKMLNIFLSIFKKCQFSSTFSLQRQSNPFQVTHWPVHDSNILFETMKWYKRTYCSGTWSETSFSKWKEWYLVAFRVRQSKRNESVSWCWCWCQIRGAESMLDFAYREKHPYVFPNRQIS